MSKNKKTVAVGAVLIVCLIAVCLSAPHGSRKKYHGSKTKYEIIPEITIPEHRTDTARIIDAYERVMDRLMGLTEKNLVGINTDVKDISRKLVLINCRLADISTRMARIEKAVGIKEPEEQKKNETKTQNGGDKPPSESGQ